MIEIKGLQKTSLIDYPGKISSVVFLGGCSFRCPYCFNRDLVLNPEKVKTIPSPEFLAFLNEKRKWLDGVVLGGGEPTTHPDLPGFIRKIKDLGLLVALETNGTNPGMLKRLIGKRLVDYFAMDIKAPLEKYDRVARVKVDKKAIQESISLIISSGTDYEFRSTILPRLHTKEDIISMAKLVKGARIYYLQGFRPLEPLLDPAFHKEKPFSEQEMEGFKKACSKYVRTELRI
jgi:pyruvate formate lyase activating enzyme